MTALLAPLAVPHLIATTTAYYALRHPAPGRAYVVRVAGGVEERVSVTLPYDEAIREFGRLRRHAAPRES